MKVGLWALGDRDLLTTGCRGRVGNGIQPPDEKFVEAGEGAGLFDRRWRRRGAACFCRVLRFNFIQSLEARMNAESKESYRKVRGRRPHSALKRDL
jgi:hypothetical protein